MLNILTPTRRAAMLAIAVSTVVFAPALALAQAYPNKPVKVIVPLSPASGGDIVARSLGEQLTQILGQPMVVENRPGAAGVIGTDALVRSPADGYTLGVISSNHVVNPGVVKNLPYDTLKDLTVISIVAGSPVIFVTSPKLPVKNLQEFIALAKSKPNGVTYGSAGNGSVLHLAGVMLATQANIDIQHVPFKGTGPLINDLIGGHVDSGFLAPAAALSHIKAGNMRALGVSSRKVDPALPDVAPLASQGLPDYEFDAWLALIGPKDMPKPLVDQLYGATQKALASDKIKEQYAAQGLGIMGYDPARSTAFMASELDKHQKLVKAGNVQAD